MLRFLLSGCSIRSIRHAKVSILGELIIMSGLAFGFLGWTEWIDPQMALEEFSDSAVKSSSDFIIFGFVTILLGLGVYLADGLFRSLRHTKRQAETSRIDTLPARDAGQVTAVRSARSRKRSTWRTRVVGTT